MYITWYLSSDIFTTPHHHNHHISRVFDSSEHFHACFINRGCIKFQAKFCVLFQDPLTEKPFLQSYFHLINSYLIRLWAAAIFPWRTLFIYREILQKPFDQMAEAKVDLNRVIHTRHKWKIITFDFYVFRYVITEPTRWHSACLRNYGTTCRLHLDQHQLMNVPE